MSRDTPLGPSLRPRTGKQGRMKRAAQAGFLAEGAIEFGWHRRRGKLAWNLVKAGAGRRGELTWHKGSCGAEYWIKWQQHGMSWSDSERRV